MLAGAGLGALLFKWLVFVRGEARRYPRPEQWLVVAVTVSLVAGSVHALVSGVVVMTASQYMMATVIALAMALYKTKPFAASSETPRSADAVLKTVFVTTTVAAAIYASLYTARDYVGRIHADAPPPATNVYLRNANEPRFWSDGTLTGLLPSSRIPGSYVRD